MGESRVWLVDLDGTLYSAAPVKLAMAAELALFAPHRVSMLRCFRKEHERLRQEQDAPLQNPFDAQLVRAAERAGHPKEQLEQVVHEWMFCRPGKWLRAFKRSALIAELRAFRRSSGRTALVSDYPARRKLQALGVSDLFDVVVASGEPGGPHWLKPHPDGFQRAARKLGVSPADCLVLGDREDADGAAARAAGMAFRLIG